LAKTLAVFWICCTVSRSVAKSPKSATRDRQHDGVCTSSRRAGDHWCLTRACFHDAAREPVKGAFLVREFCEARDRAGVADFRFHDLRHTFATGLVQRGIDLYKVQRLLGHKTNHMTQRYAHHSPESLREGVKILERPSCFGTILTQSANEPRGEICKPLI
jgi:integrase